MTPIPSSGAAPGTSGGVPTPGTSTSPLPATTAPNVKYADYADYVAQTLLAARIGTIPEIPDALKSAELDAAILTDPAQIQAYRDDVAEQLNKGSGGPRFTDLSDRISDITIDTTAQGAGTLEVQLIDPMWVIPTSGFIQADEEGYLWPPIDITLPPGTSCVWRLCQYRPSWSTTEQANLVLTFEDRIVSILREMSAANGIRQGLPNQTLAGFLGMLVDSANKTMRPNPPLKFVALVNPKDPNYTPQITQVPKSPEGTLRKNPNKTYQGLAAEMKHLLAEIQAHDAPLLQSTPPGHETSIRSLENRLAHQLGTSGSFPRLSSSGPPPPVSYSGHGDPTNYAR